MAKVALVTGGTRGIGFGIAKRLGADGFNVIITGTRDADNCKDCVHELEKEGINCFYIKSNIGISEDRINLVKEVVEKFGRIDVLVNNAGVAPLERKDLLEMTEESFDRVVGINTKGNMFLTQLVAKQMIKQEYLYKKKGTIINISSCSAEVSSISRGEYCVSKSGIAMLTKLYADRLAPENILVHEVRPGVIMTDMTGVVKEKYDKLIEDGIFPIKRWGMPEDVANATSFFASDDCLYTTGNYIDVDGGFHIKTL